MYISHVGIIRNMVDSIAVLLDIGIRYVEYVTW